MSDERREALRSALTAVRGRVDAAASASGRAGSTVTIIVVTKTFPVSDLRTLYGLGVRDFGENRHQEAKEKVAALADLELRWHFVGQVQSNKAARIAEYAAVVHAVDSCVSCSDSTAAPTALTEPSTASSRSASTLRRVEAAGAVHPLQLSPRSPMRS